MNPLLQCWYDSSRGVEEELEKLAQTNVCSIPARFERRRADENMIFIKLSSRTFYPTFIFRNDYYTKSILTSKENRKNCIWKLRK